MSPVQGLGLSRENFPLPSPDGPSLRDSLFFLLYLGELGGLRGREKGSEGYQRECLLN